MLKTYQYPKYPFVRPAELDHPEQTRHVPVVVVGAGPVGMCAALDLAQKGKPVLLLDDDDTVSIGSRGVCYAKRALEILDRLGVGERVVQKGVSWNVGRTFYRNDEVFSFNLVPEPDHHRPGMVNLQQYYLEEYLVDACRATPGLEMRWKNKVIAVTPGETVVALRVETPEGAYSLTCDWLIVADGARSPIRHMLGLDIEGKIFMDRFLIADVVMKADFPAERWFWFDPPFHPGQSVLLHKQADNVWRIDFQLGWDADPELEKRPERVIPRIQAMLGDDREFELEWVSVYTFQCRRMNRFNHGRVLFVGDAAHQVSPFGARGANSGTRSICCARINTSRHAGVRSTQTQSTPRLPVPPIATVGRTEPKRRSERSRSCHSTPNPTSTTRKNTLSTTIPPVTTSTRFELPTRPPMGRDPNTPAWTQHIAFEVESMDVLLETKARLEAEGIEVVGPTDHALFQSIYFFDPNGHRIELAANTLRPGMLEALDKVKWEMLEAWRQTKRAPQHARWMHDGRYKTMFPESQ